MLGNVREFSKFKFYMILCIGIDFDACRDNRKPPAGPPSAPREPSGTHLSTFAEYSKNDTIWIMPFWGLLEQIINIALVLYAFLTSHNEAQFEPCCKSALFIIHLRVKLQCIFIDSDVFANQKKGSDFRFESLCVALNACTYYSECASFSENWFAWMTNCSFLIQTQANVISSCEAFWGPHDRK